MPLGPRPKGRLHFLSIARRFRVRPCLHLRIIPLYLTTFCRVGTFVCNDGARPGIHSPGAPRPFTHPRPLSRTDRAGLHRAAPRRSEWAGLPLPPEMPAVVCLTHSCSGHSAWPCRAVAVAVTARSVSDVNKSRGESKFHDSI